MVRRLGAVLCFVLVAGLAVTGCKNGEDDDDQQNARLRVVHASPDAPAVDIYAAGNSTPLFSNLTYGQTTEYEEVAAGAVNIEVRPAGAAADSAPVFSTGNIDLAADTTYTAVAAGLLNSTEASDSFRILPLTEGFTDPATGNAQARFVHAAPDAPSVLIDVGDDGTNEVGPVARFEATPPEGFPLPAGQALQVAVLAGDPPAKVTAFTTPQLDENKNYFLIATGLLDSQPREDDAFSLLAVGPDGTVGRIQQNPTLYALHASPDAPPVDIFTGATELVADLSFGDLSGPVQVAPGVYPLDFFATEAGTTRPTGDPAASVTTTALAAGQQYLAIATGFLGAGQTPSFQLVAVEETFDLTPTAARLRAVHASPGTPAVDVGAIENGTFSPLITDLSFGEASEPPGLELTPANYVIGFAPTGDTTPAAAFPLDLAAGDRVFGVAAGLLMPGNGQPPLRLIVVDTTTSPWTATSVANQL